MQHKRDIVLPPSRAETTALRDPSLPN